MSARSRFRRGILLAAEAGGSLLLVLAVFWGFITFLYALFPSGTPLRELVEIDGAPLQRRAQTKRQAEATLAFMLRDVRLRRGNSIAWGGAREGMQLFSQDAVQTFDRSGAGISFGAGDRLDVGSNSLVMVTRLDAGEEPAKRSYRVQVDGELHGRLSAGGKLGMELSAAGHLARLAPGAARFRISPYGERGATLAVFAGEARVSGAGRTVRVPAHFGVVLITGAAPGPVLPLPAAPLPEGAGAASYRYRMLPPRVRFAWSGRSGDYHLQLSKDPGFTDCLYDERVQLPEFVTGKLAKGHYFWRVSRLERGVEGEYGRVGRCELVQLLDAPKLQVDFPVEHPAAGPCRLTGRAEPGSRVLVDGSEAACRETGQFERELQLKPGVNLIRVEAFDAVGNATYASRVVYCGSGNNKPDPATR